MSILRTIGNFFGGIPKSIARTVGDVAGSIRNIGSSVNSALGGVPGQILSQIPIAKHIPDVLSGVQQGAKVAEGLFDIAGGIGKEPIHETAGKLYSEGRKAVRQGQHAVGRAREMFG